MSDNDKTSQQSMKTRSVAMSQTSTRSSSVSEARIRLELSNLKAKQAQRAALAKAELARLQAEAEAQAARLQAEAEAQAALDQAEQDALELALLEKVARGRGGPRSVSRPHRDTPRPSSDFATQQCQQRHESPTAAPALPSKTPQRSLARVTQQEAWLPALQPPKMFPPQPTTPAVQTRDIVDTTSKEEDASILLQLSPLRVIGPCGQRKVDELDLIDDRVSRCTRGRCALGRPHSAGLGGDREDVGIRKRAGGTRWTLALGHITRPPQLAPG